MKVLHICTNDTGGAFQAAYNLHLGLLDAGTESEMLVLKKSDSNLTNTTSFIHSRSPKQKILHSIQYRMIKYHKKLL